MMVYSGFSGRAAYLVGNVSSHSAASASIRPGIEAAVRYRRHSDSAATPCSQRLPAGAELFESARGKSDRSIAGLRKLFRRIEFAFALGADLRNAAVIAQPASVSMLTLRTTVLDARAISSNGTPQVAALADERV